MRPAWRGAWRLVVGWRSRGGGRMMPTVAEQPPAGIQCWRQPESRTGAGAAQSLGNFALCAVVPVARRHGGVPSGEEP